MLAVRFYDVVLTVHILAVVAAFGVVFAYLATREPWSFADPWISATITRSCW